jgi:hypothetical protein
MVGVNVEVGVRVAEGVRVAVAVEVGDGVMEGVIVGVGVRLGVGEMTGTKGRSAGSPMEPAAATEVGTGEGNSINVGSGSSSRGTQAVTRKSTITTAALLRRKKPRIHRIRPTIPRGRPGICQRLLYAD